jgi:hypothetical protein
MKNKNVCKSCQSTNGRHKIKCKKARQDIIDFMLKYLPDVKDIATNDMDWTILNFKDGEKIIVKCSQAYDLEKGILYAYAKKHRPVKPEFKSSLLDAEIQKTHHEIANLILNNRESLLFNPVADGLQQQHRCQETKMRRESSHNQKRLDKIIWELHKRKRKRQIEKAEEWQNNRRDNS